MGGAGGAPRAAAASSMALAADGIMARARFNSVARTTRDATTSVRLWVSATGPKEAAADPPDHHHLGTGIEGGRRRPGRRTTRPAPDRPGPSGRDTVTSRLSSRVPDGSTRS